MKTNENQKSTSHQPVTQKPFFGAAPEQAFFTAERTPSTPFFQKSSTIQAKSTTDENEELNQSAVQRMSAFESEVKDNGAVQRKFVNSSPIQAKLAIGEPGDKYEKKPDRVASQMVGQSQDVYEQRPNQTGLPDNLKSGIESLSGISLNNVKVHYNSSQPAQLSALAYAQGTDIHLAPGQEKHLPHEAWHVVQQARGRVQPTHQLRGVDINDDEGLEREAEQMGSLALASPAAAFGKAPIQTMPFNSPPLQRSNFARSIVQRVGGVKSGYDPDTIVKESFKTAVKELFDLARKVNKIRKKIATLKNKDQLDRLGQGQKGSQVKGAYASSLIAINLDPKWLNTMLTEPNEIQRILDDAVAIKIIALREAELIRQKITELKTKVSVKLDSEEILDQTWKVEDGGPQPTAKILTGVDALYVIKIPKDESKGVFRDVYRKLGKSDGEHLELVDHNEYVMDDFRKPTRRYAYMEKGYYQWMSFKEKGFLTGKTQNLIGATTDVASDTIDPTNFRNQKLTQEERALYLQIEFSFGDTPENRKIALAYMHQWKGSGPGQRGLSLASTDKENAVFGNAGEPFKTADGAKFKVDLAKINPADNILINHYSIDSQTRSKLEGDGKDSNRLLARKYEYERSVIKNREIYIRNLKPEAVVSITPHATGVDIDRDSAIFNAQKKAAIDSSQAAKSAKAVEDRKAMLQQDLAQAHQKKSAAQRAMQTANDNLRVANINLSLCNPRYLKKSWREDLKVRMTDYNYWQYVVEYWSRAMTQQMDLIKQADVAIAALPAQILECDPQIVHFKSLIKAKPDGSNAHATKGWATGELYMQGYEAGLKSVQGKKMTKDQAIREIFNLAYKDGAKKASAEKEGRQYPEYKYEAYWVGYGNALKTAVV
ncbi:hypothetical protein NIES2100_29890 [Calothrix sp. NIES-2100]|uniref:eCIS core domain-containing protein n=1 Tax=Calothrix sp. NIES-2100 TaxID=1954172 RepID=UPI000B5EDCF1|nr:hypothetical protein NIES2100_29890 [Calothrix sp. NIES-2100]